MESLRNLLPRDMSDSTSSSLINVMVALLSLVLFSLLFLVVLFVLRRLRLRQQMQAQSLPQYSSESKWRGGLTIHTASSKGSMRSSVIVIDRDGQPMLTNPRSPPHSPDNVPEIHITFPDEQDEQGRRKSGRVVVVRVGETSVGLEPLREEDQLPAYEKEDGARFYAIDMDRIGGLKEKEPRSYL